jgi:myo-inositol-1(or 4)-monophosphatase
VVDPLDGTINFAHGFPFWAVSIALELIATALPVDFRADADRQMSLFRRFSTGTHSVRRTGSSALNLALVAAGGLDVCYATFMNPWDAAAGVVLVREAGGVVTDLRGSTYDVYGEEILATNGRVHAESLGWIDESDPGRAPAPLADRD